MGTQLYTEGNIYKSHKLAALVSHDRHYKTVSWYCKHTPSPFTFLASETFNQGSPNAFTALGRPTGSGDNSLRTNPKPPSSLTASLKAPLKGSSIDSAFPPPKCQTKNSF